MNSNNSKSKWMRLVRIVIESSVSKDWDTAKFEWIPSPFSKSSLPGLPCEDYSCLCTHPHIVKLFTITNKHNLITLQPIGSKCIQRFGTEVMLNAVREAEKLDRAAKKNGVYCLPSSEERPATPEPVTVVVVPEPVPVVVVPKPVPVVVHSYEHYATRTLTKGKFAGVKFEDMLKPGKVWYIKFIRSNGQSNEIKDLLLYIDGAKEEQEIKHQTEQSNGCLL